MAVLPGNVEYPEARVIPYQTIAAAGAGSLPAGSLTLTASGWCGITQHDCDDGDKTGIVVDVIVRVPRTTGGGTAWTEGALLTAVAIGGAGADQDAYRLEIATPATDPIHAIAVEAAADAATDGVARLLLPPYHTAP